MSIFTDSWTGAAPSQKWHSTAAACRRFKCSTSKINDCVSGVSNVVASCWARLARSWLTRSTAALSLASRAASPSASVASINRLIRAPSSSNTRRNPLTTSGLGLNAKMSP